MISAGPFSIQVVILIVAVLLAWVITRKVAQRLPDTPAQEAGGLLLDAVFWGLVAARLGYILQWWSDYAASPLSMIAIGDGGFSGWSGVLGGVAFAWWRTRTMPALRRPLLVGSAAGVLSWSAATGVLGLIQLAVAPPLPELQLNRLDADPVVLSEYTGRPVVVNLWASWCPPCRREMPVLEQAQSHYPGIAIVMVNQGESAAQARDFLAREHLTFQENLLDPAGRLMRDMGARGLPTTLFFDAQGRLVDSHVGELTRASLRDTLSRHFQPLTINTAKE